MTLTPAMMRAIEYLGPRQRPVNVRPPNPLTLEQLVEDRLAVRTTGNVRVPPYALSGFGITVLEAYRMGQRRWGASGR